MGANLLLPPPTAMLVGVTLGMVVAVATVVVTVVPVATSEMNSLYPGYFLPSCCLLHVPALTVVYLALFFVWTLLLVFEAAPHISMLG